MHAHTEVSNNTFDNRKYRTLFPILFSFLFLTSVMERRPNSKVPYVHSLCVQNQPASNAGSSCLSLPCPVPWPLTSFEPRPWRATWQVVQASRLSWQTQTRFAPEIIADPEAFLHKCASRIDFQWLLLAPNFIQLLCLVSFFRRSDEREKRQIKEWWDKRLTHCDESYAKTKNMTRT